MYRPLILENTERPAFFVNRNEIVRYPGGESGRYHFIHPPPEIETLVVEERSHSIPREETKCFRLRRGDGVVKNTIAVEIAERNRHRVLSERDDVLFRELQIAHPKIEDHFIRQPIVDDKIGEIVFIKIHNGGIHNGHFRKDQRLLPKRSVLVAAKN